MTIGPKLVAISGPPCSGKSTIARELHRRTGIVHLELDLLRSRLLPESRQDQNDRDTTYRAMHLIAEYLVRAGHPVILDATYGRVNQRQALLDLSNSTGAMLRVVQCRVSPELALRRFQQRPSGHFAVDLSEARVLDLTNGYDYEQNALLIAGDAEIGTSVATIESYI